LPDIPSIMYVFRIGALVPYHGQVVPIVNRYVERYGARYIIHTKAKNGALVQHHDVTFGQIVSAMCDHATHCVGDKLEIGPWDRYVKARWWNNRRGTVLYRIGDILDSGRSHVMTQEELAKRTAAFAGVEE
jgi:hypothetical protein